MHRMQQLYDEVFAQHHDAHTEIDKVVHHSQPDRPPETPAERFERDTNSVLEAMADDILREESDKASWYVTRLLAVVRTRLDPVAFSAAVPFKVGRLRKLSARTLRFVRLFFLQYPVIRDGIEYRLLWDKTGKYFVPVRIRPPR